MSSIPINERLPLGWAEFHEHPFKEFEIRHRIEVQRARDWGGEAVRNLLPLLVRRIADTRNLRIAYDHLSDCGGHAPGPDGLTYNDMSEADVWSMLRLLRRLILDGNYVPGPLRKARIPKGGNRGRRPLWLANILDRVVARGIVQIIEPLLAPGFSAYSFCRRGQGPLKALATAEEIQWAGNYTTWITEDIRDMFEQIPLRRLLQIVEKRLPDMDLVQLIERTIQRDGAKGLRQGSSLSPLLAELYLNHCVDRRWAKLRPDTPLLRYMDDLLLLCDHDPIDFHRDLAQVCQDAGLPLKHGPDSSIRRLDAGEEASWLGYRLSLSEGQLRVRIALDHNDNDCLYHRLYDRLVRLHERPDAPLRAARVIEGMITHAAPCYPHSDHRAFYGEVVAASRDAAFTEILPLDIFTRRWHRAHESWRERREIWLDNDWCRPGPMEPSLLDDGEPF